MTTFAENNYAKKNRRAVLMDIKKLREKRRIQWKEADATMEIMANELGDVILTLSGGFWFSPNIVVSRNSANNPRDYARVTPTGQGEVVVQVKDFMDRIGKLAYRKVLQTENMLTVLHTVKAEITKMDKADNHTQGKRTNKPLINISEDQNGQVTVTVMKRDGLGRFLPKPLVEPNYEVFTLDDLTKMKAPNLSVVSYRRKTVITLKGQRLEINK